jgi:hypothetical protein
VNFHIEYLNCSKKSSTAGKANKNGYVLKKI